MQVNIISVGNSLGIRIPKAILKQYGFKNQADLTVENGKIIITPIDKIVRQDWAEAAKNIIDDQEDKILDANYINHLSDDKDWQW